MGNWYLADPKHDVWQRNIDDRTSQFASMTQVGGGRYRLGRATITADDVREYIPYLIEEYMLDSDSIDHATLAFCLYDSMTSSYLVGEPTDMMAVDNMLTCIVGKGW
jgi:hypothetical protein